MALRHEQGSALVTVLIIVTALTIVTGSLMAILTLHHRLARRDLHRMQAFYFAEAGIYKTLWFLSKSGEFAMSQLPLKHEVAVAAEQMAQVSIAERGGFLQITSKARVKDQIEQITVTVGQKMPQAFDQAIILGGADLPLVVTGRNRIVGDVTVGKSGVKPGTIKGVKFSGERLVTGRINRVSPPQMPYFNPVLYRQAMQRFRDFLTKRPDAEFDFVRQDSASETSGQVLYVAGEIDLNALADSLREGPLTLYSDGDITISGTLDVLHEMDIVARGKVAITGSVFFDDAVVYSEDAISVADSVSGALQLLTPGDIIVGGNARLDYPSVLYTQGRIQENKHIGAIIIRENASITGTVILDVWIPKDADGLRSESMIQVEENAHVTGVIFSSNRTTIAGRVDGLVVADHFYLYESPTTYINWLKDAAINRRNLDANFKLPLFFAEKPSWEIVAWNRLD